MERFPIVLLFLHIAVFWKVSVVGVVKIESAIIISNDPAIVTGQLPAGGSCCFNNTLCSYIQGHRHQYMNNWTATINRAVTSQNITYGSGDSIYTDLESPPLTFDNACCVEFRYISHSPSTLSMVGVLNGTDHELYKGPNIENGGGLSILITVPRDIQMLKFRAYGRGGGATYPPVALHYVTFHLGSCSGPECNFSTSQQLHTLCGWETNGWEAGQKHVARLHDSVDAGTLTTGLVKSTPSAGICVQFNYTMNSVNDTLSMLKQPADDSAPYTVWKITNNNTQSDSWTSAAVCVISDIAFKLVFSAKRCTSLHSQIAIRNVISTPITNTYPLSPCRQQSSQPPAQNPQYEGCALKRSTTTTTKISSASTNVTDNPVTTNSNSSSGSHSTSIENITTSGGPSLSTHSATREATDTTADAQTHTDDDSVGVAVGSALAGVGVIGSAVIIAVVVWKKRKQKGKGTEDKNVLKSSMKNLQPNGSSHGNNAGPASKNTYSAARNPAFSVSLHSVGDYSEVNDTEHSENPYDDAAPDEADLSTSDGYSHVDILGADKKKKQTTSVTNPYELAGALPSEDNDTDEYNHLNLQPGAKKLKINSARSAGQPDYSHIGGHSKPPPQDVHPAPHNKGTAPAAANQQEDEYNRMNAKQALGTRRQRDAPLDVYNRLGQDNAAFDEGTDATDGEYNTIGEKTPKIKATKGSNS